MVFDVFDDLNGTLEMFAELDIAFIKRHLSIKHTHLHLYISMILLGI